MMLFLSGLCGRKGRSEFLENRKSVKKKKTLSSCYEPETIYIIKKKKLKHSNNTETQAKEMHPQVSPGVPVKGLSLGRG